MIVIESDKRETEAGESDSAGTRARTRERSDHSRLNLLYVITLPYRRECNKCLTSYDDGEDRVHTSVRNAWLYTPVSRLGGTLSTRDTW